MESRLRAEQGAAGLLQPDGPHLLHAGAGDGGLQPSAGAGRAEDVGGVAADGAEMARAGAVRDVPGIRAHAVGAAAGGRVVRDRQHDELIVRTGSGTGRAWKT